MLRLSLAARITMIVVIALLAAWVAAIAVFYRSQVGQGSARATPSQIASIVELLARAPQEQRERILEAVSSHTLSVRFDAGGPPAELPRGSRPAPEDLIRPYADALGGRLISITTSPPHGVGQRLPRVFPPETAALEFRIALGGGETLVIETASPVPITRLGLPIGFGAGLLGTLVALVALIIMHRETRPLTRIAAAADRMNLSVEPELLPQNRTSAPEIQALIAAFNRLQTRLSQLLRARMAMLGGISHDVRTFATRLRLRVERIPDPTDRDRAIVDIDDMIRLLDDALLASRAGAGEMSEELVEFGELVRSEVEDRKAAGAPVDLRINLHGGSGTVLGDRVALRRIVANLVDNALAYGQRAHLAVESGEYDVTLTVDDEGPGIPAEFRGILLEPFVRVETSRARRTGGAGLGLAVVGSLVEAHGGRVAIDEAPGGGARFTVAVPLFQR
ncbi:MAG: sensor histidine kinase [Pseudorhodoplanes sp.]